MIHLGTCTIFPFCVEQLAQSPAPADRKSHKKFPRSSFPIGLFWGRGLVLKRGYRRDTFFVVIGDGCSALRPVVRYIYFPKTAPPYQTGELLLEMASAVAQ